MNLLPNIMASLVDKTGKVLEPWRTYLQQFAQAPAPILTIDVDVSPFSYQIKEPGNIYITGGTITGLTFTRGTETLVLSVNSQRLIPVSFGDIIEITYSVLPTLKFLPNYATRRDS